MKYYTKDYVKGAPIPLMKAGDTIDHWTFIKFVEPRYGRRTALFRCIDGTERTKPYSPIFIPAKSGHPRSCGCMWTRRSRPTPATTKGKQRIIDQKSMAELLSKAWVRPKVNLRIVV